MASSKKKGTVSTESYKGVRDFYPEDFALQTYLFETWRAFAESYGYTEYSASVLEPAELYKAKGVENEEIVRDQTYTFVDRGKREVTLRPEMTPTVARMVAARRRELSFPLRWYSIPNIFRYERPQRGRLREHWQLNVDLFGSQSIAADVEIIAMAHGLMRAFGATEKDFTVHVSSRAFLNALAEECSLDEEKKRALLLLLDRRTKISPEVFAQELAVFGISPEKLSPAKEPADVAAVLAPLRDAGLKNISYDPSVVRGFAYYTGVVFEVFDTHPENNRSLFGGGRYDNLLTMFGEEVPAVGFGMGDVTIHDFLKVRGLLPPYKSPVQVYVAITGAELVSEAMKLAEELRQGGVATAVDLGDKNLGDQIKAADKQKIPFIIVVGPDELVSGQFTLKELASGAETKVEREKIANLITLK